MLTSAFVTYMSEIVGANYSRSRILDMINKAQNEILGNANRITRISPDPFVHTGSADLVSHASNNTSGAGTFEVTTTIATTTPTKGYLLVTSGSTVYKYKYSSYSGAIFTLASGVTLTATFANGSYTSHATNNVLGDSDFVIQETIDVSTPQTGYIVVTSGGDDYTYEYSSYSGSTFTLASGVTLTATFTGSDTVIVKSVTATVDKYDLIASGAIFSSVENSRTEQYDIRTVTRIYAFQDKNSSFGAYNYSTVNSFRPDVIENTNSLEVDITFDSIESLEPSNEDAKAILWRENSPGTSSGVYLAECYRWPNQLSSEAVALTIPSQFQTTTLKFGILKDLEYKEYGKNNHPEQLYEKYLREFLSQTSVIPSSNVKKTLPRF